MEHGKHCTQSLGAQAPADSNCWSVQRYEPSVTGPQEVYRPQMRPSIETESIRYGGRQDLFVIHHFRRMNDAVYKSSHTNFKLTGKLLRQPEVPVGNGGRGRS